MALIKGFTETAINLNLVELLNSKEFSDLTTYVEEVENHKKYYKITPKEMGDHAMMTFSELFRKHATSCPTKHFDQNKKSQ